MEILIVLVDRGSTIGLLTNLRMEVLHQFEGLLAENLRNLQARLRDVWESGIANRGKSSGDQQRRRHRELHFENKVWFIASENDRLVEEESYEILVC